MKEEGIGVRKKNMAGQTELERERGRAKHFDRVSNASRLRR